jgi:hypothetical protein
MKATEPLFSEAARHYAEQGIPVFPCSPKNKSPMVNGGFHSATTDANQIKAWWTKWPKAMIGMPTGPASGIDVLDLDVDQNKGKNGLAELPDWQQRSPIIVRTPRGGAHLWFKSNGSIRNSTDIIAHGVDTRGEGGYVILPPSRNGAAAYRFEKGSETERANLLAFPADLQARLHIEDGPRTPNEDLTADPVLLAAAMAEIPNDDLPREEWNRIGMACWAAFGGSAEGFAAFDAWARKSKKYHGGTVERWRHYFKSPPSKLGAGSIIYWANKASPGWREAYDAPALAGIAEFCAGLLRSKTEGAP